MGCSGSRASGPMTEEEKLCVAAEDTLPLNSLQLTTYESIINKYTVEDRIEADQISNIIKDIIDASGYKPKDTSKSAEVTKGTQTAAEEPKYIRGEELLRKILTHTFFKDGSKYNAPALKVPGILYCKGSSNLKAKTLFESIDLNKVGVIMCNSSTTEKLIEATLLVPMDMILTLAYPETTQSDVIQKQEYKVQAWSSARKELEKILIDVLFYQTSEAAKDFFINKVSGSLKFMVNPVDARAEALKKSKSGDHEVAGAVTKSIIQNQGPPQEGAGGSRRGSRRLSVEEIPVGMGASIR